jgi:hypothetical protein
MRYFPQRARNKTDIGRKLKICTYCLGDMFTNGRCVQCHARVSITPMSERLAMLGSSITRPEPLQT